MSQYQLGILLAVLSAGCGGTVGVGTINGAVQGVGESGARRLTRAEYDNTVRDLLGDTSHLGTAMLPEDYRDPFDNSYATQQVSPILIETAEALAEQLARQLIADRARRDQVIGCTPAGADDTACLRKFIIGFGRRALRRPLTDDEVIAYLGFQTYATEDRDFYTAVAMVLRSMLQDAEFLYRIETGAPVPGRNGLFKLNSWEMASRLSYFVWGSTPDDALLDLAAADRLATGSEIRAAAMRLLRDPRAQERVDRFHALWLGYFQLPHAPQLSSAMRREADALVNRVVFEERRSWLDLLRSSETFIDATLAQHYGLPAPAAPAWVSYGSSGRKGILSQGAFLSVAAKFGDTSPTQRGKLIRERLLCQTIPPPPPTVNVDMPPTSETSRCKFDRYASHRSQGSCASCHSQMDPVGFGLENYDQAGRYRSTDSGAPECIISGEGEWVGVGKFHGPGQLSDLLLSLPEFERCMVQQLYRFAMGHHEEEGERPYLDALGAAFKHNGHKLDELILSLVSAEAFGYRLEK